jgi:peptide/nickel transport system permease protein
VPRWRILGGELLPNILGPLMVEASLRLTYSIGVIAALAFLGLSPDPNGPNWGTMIKQNQIALSTQPWGALVPILALAVLTMGTGLIGDGISRTAAGIDRERGEE